MNGYVTQLMNADIVAFKNRAESKISKYQRACCFEQWMSAHRGDTACTAKEITQFSFTVTDSALDLIQLVS